jgi:hypothetical protein
MIKPLTSSRKASETALVSVSITSRTISYCCARSKLMCHHYITVRLFLVQQNPREFRHFEKKENSVPCYLCLSVVRSCNIFEANLIVEIFSQTSHLENGGASATS